MPESASFNARLDAFLLRRGVTILMRRDGVSFLLRGSGKAVPSRAMCSFVARERCFLARGVLYTADDVHCQGVV